MCRGRTRLATADEAAEFRRDTAEAEELAKVFEAGLAMPIGAGAATRARIDELLEKFK